MLAKEREAYEKYVEFSKVVKNMYLKIINYEIHDNTDNSEYKAIMEILPTAVEIENKYFKQMNIGPSNIKEIQRMINVGIENLPVKIMNLDSDELDLLRRSNKTDDIMLKLNEGIEIPTQVSSIMELIEIKNTLADFYNMKFADSFFYVVVNNIIKLTDEAIANEKNKVFRDYLINVKYRLIATTPSYEDNYLFFHKRALPFLTFDSIYIDNFEKETILDLSYNSVHDGIITDITDLMNVLNNGEWGLDNALVAERIVITNQARLIALDSLELIDDLEQEMIPFIALSSNTSKLFLYISRIFMGARDILESKNKRTR